MPCHLVADKWHPRIRDYARLLASVGINTIAINNANVHYEDTKLMDNVILQVKNRPMIFRCGSLFLCFTEQWSKRIK